MHIHQFKNQFKSTIPHGMIFTCFNISVVVKTYNYWWYMVYTTFVRIFVYY